MLSRAPSRFRRLPRWGQALVVLLGLGGTVGIGALAVFLYSQTQSNSGAVIRRWFADPASRRALITTLREPCPGAPFLLPTDGLIGLLWRDPAVPYHIFRRHTGLDIFGDGAPGTVPVVAAYAGYLTRLDGWLSSVIIRHDDPLRPGHTIWTYYTHMASRDGRTSYIADAFPPGTSEVWVEQGTLLGYQGDYSGGALSVGMHLHFSIVESEPGGSFKNESHLANTLDPSPYLGMPLNINSRPARPITCRS